MSGKRESTAAANMALSVEHVGRIFGGAARPLLEEAPAPEEEAPPAAEKPRRPKKAAAVAAPERRKPVPTSVRMWPDQLATLRRLAVARHAEAGVGAPDMGAIVREALDEYLERHAAEVAAA